MDELEGFKKRIHSLIERVYDGHVILLPFLDMAWASILLEETKYESFNVYFNGGVNDADRNRFVLTNYDSSSLDFKIICLKINYNKKYYDINHRNVLGSLMSLGIKRECIGDIIVKENKDIYFFVTEEILPFILNEFKAIGKASIELEIVNEKIDNEIRYEIKKDFISSLRLDVVVASMFNLSRKEVLDILQSKGVFVNSLLNQNPSFNCKLNDKISVRHYGKFEIGEILGNSRSGRICVVLKKRV